MADELGFNKIAAAILVTALGFMGLKEISHAVMHVEAPEKPAYALEIAETGATTEAVIDLPFPQAEWVAAMDAERGAKVFKKCTSCHNTEAGGGNGTGPNLYDIVGKAAAAKAGFKYSGAMSSAAITWDYESLDTYLTRPGKFVPGTNMSFVGLKKDKDRAAVIEFLRQASANPMARPLPAAAAPAAAVEAPVVEKTEITDKPEDHGDGH